VIYGLYTSAAGAFVQTKQVDVIANNIANANTTGFRKDFITLMERPAEVYEFEMDGGEPEFIYRHDLLDKLGGGPHFMRSYFDVEPGTIHETKRKLDLAMTEKGGFFAIERENEEGTETFYTRSGNFYLDGEGFLRTADGEGYVLSDDGQRIELPTEDLTIDDRGNIFFGENVVSLGIFDFEDYTKLAKVGESLFRPTGGMVAEESGARVQQGFLEGSSTEAVVEMTNMISAMRAYESNIQLMRQQDSTLERLIGTIGRPSA
jgi:flagellar basal-body rod protein FlgG